jgi:hypothetical protein
MNTLPNQAQNDLEEGQKTSALQCYTCLEREGRFPSAGKGRAHQFFFVSKSDLLSARRADTGYRKGDRMSDSPRLPARPSLEQLQKQAKELLRAHRGGDGSARARIPAAHPTLADAQFTLAREYGFEDWAALKRHVQSLDAPDYRIDSFDGTLSVAGSISPRGWDTIAAVMEEHRLEGLRAPSMTDAGLLRISRLDRLARLDCNGATELTDAGLACLAQLPRLADLDLCAVKGITDRGIEVLRDLPALRRIRFCWQPNITDAGIAALTHCSCLEEVDLLGTHTGDGAIRALTGKPALRRLKTGRNVTDAGLALLHHFPIFKTWQGGEPRYGLMSFTADPNHLLIDGPFTDAGLASLAGLDGLFGLSFFWHASAFTGAGLQSLEQLPHLGFLGCGGEQCGDDAMDYITALPRLRMLMAQGTVASDDGFAALRRSRSLEYLWGRECPNLTSHGFRALSEMPALRGLAVSCKLVDDDALAILPRFPALRELMPMDVSDDGFRHIGLCGRLEDLWCMYCRETGDAATGHIAGLALRSYYAGKTQITDRSLEILSGMESLERLELHYCSGITNEGIARLAHLPKLREIGLEGTGVGALDKLFPVAVRVRY